MLDYSISASENPCCVIMLIQNGTKKESQLEKTTEFLQCDGFG